MVKGGKMPYKDPEVNRAYKRQWELAQREAKHRAQATWDAEHPEEALLRDGEILIKKWVRRGEYLFRKIGLNRAWYVKNAERISTEAKHAYQHDAKKRAAIDARNKRYAEAHAEEIRAYFQQWVKDHPEQIAVIAGKRRARLGNAPVNDLTPAQWREIKETFKHCCAYCGKKSKKLTMDHITPLIKGGSHTASNIVPACKSCNSKKHTGPPLRPVQPVLLTLAPSHDGRAVP
jgi:5-methylcytosine-specific restriction endonuclease McrA